MTKNKITPQSLVRLELLCSLGSSYGKSTKKEKMLTLDFLHKQFGVSKNTLAKLLRRASLGPLRSQIHLRGRNPIYCDLCVQHLKKLWHLLGEMGPEKMKAALPIWLPHYIEEYKLSSPLAEKLMQMSARTIARLLEPYKKSLAKKDQCKTHAASKRMKYKIPVKNFGMSIKTPGFVEADTVAHCGKSILGPHHWTLTVTDINTTWTELEIMNDKSARKTKEAVACIQARLPFPIKHFHSDCGTEFLNDEIMQHLNNPKKYVVQTRGRAYKKNDQAHVEQKNHSHVRELIGYYRYDTNEELQLIADIYRNEQRLLMNFFTPQRKLLEKVKIGSHYKRTYGPMKTPYSRVMDSESVSEITKNQLKELFSSLNPITLRHSLNDKIHRLMNLKNRSEGKIAA